LLRFKKGLKMKKRTVIAAALGECVHVAGVLKFLSLAEMAGWRTIFLGPAVPIGRVLETARREGAQMVGVSYRLTPQTGERLLAQFAEAADDLHSGGVRFVFAGTPPLARAADAIGFFERTFEGGESQDEILAYLKGEATELREEEHFPQSTIERIRWKAPFPILRHHFGLPDMQSTRQGISRIAQARVLDVISLGTDQDAQENFFHSERQDPRRKGAGGVPVRTPADFEALYQASRCGNYPLLRTYTGCDDFIRLAKMYVETINIAWAAVPLFWFNRMDGRGPWDLEGSLRQHQQLIAWYGKQGIPVELNEPHHWGLRSSPDVIFVVSGYLSAYNARALGVHDYIAQMMFNSPAGLSDVMDLARMAAILDLIQPLEGYEFRVWRQVRTGLLSYPLDIDAARSHLSTSIYLQMALKPHIVHVVGHTEAQHAATAEDIIEACKMARHAIEKAIYDQPNMLTDGRVLQRKEELIAEASVTLDAIRSLSDDPGVDPLTDPTVLTRSVTGGILDAPDLSSNPYARGEIVAHIDQRGACVAIDPHNAKPISEEQRIARLRSNSNRRNIHE
jgi:methylmalonyl-CoA mutase cobalamin-binding subunit